MPLFKASLIINKNYFTSSNEGKCDEDDSDRAFYCNKDSDCKNKTDIHLWHGITFFIFGNEFELNHFLLNKIRYSNR